MKSSIAHGVLIIVLIGLMVFLIRIMRKQIPTKDEFAHNAVLSAFNDWRQCAMAHMDGMRNEPEKVWNNFAAVTTHCTSITNVSKIKLVSFENKDETKHYILSKDVTKPSVVVSLGIGADIGAEEQLKETLPKDTEFFGADPVVVPNAALFSKVGKFFPFAVSADDGLHEAQIRLSNGSYGAVVVEHINILRFFLTMLERNFIDHMIMDNEGPEYAFVPMIAINNVFHRNAICICHMNVEFHDPGQSKGYGNFAKIMWNLLVTGRFGIIHNLRIGHQRMFLVNYEDRRCVEKYLEQFFK